MFEQNPKEEILFIIKEIESDPKATQRKISANLGISLGKTNYLLRKLIQEGFVKVKGFSQNSRKFKKFNYILTRKGSENKISLMCHFLKKKEDEYNSFKKELEQIRAKG